MEGIMFTPRTVKEAFARGPAEASAPCRIDMGGTVDLPTFHYALRHLAPSTFNAAVALRTHVRVSGTGGDTVRVSSKGFDTVEFPLDEAPFDHPMGLIFGIASWFRAGGVHIEIASQSPPRSSLGGSSSAAVAVAGALSAALARVGGGRLTRRETVLLAHAVESVCARVPCGMQDHLAAAYGGVHEWTWPAAPAGPAFLSRVLVPPSEHAWLEDRMALAFCGVEHVSADVNGAWVARFLSGRDRDLWEDICRLSAEFSAALAERRLSDAMEVVERELAIRLEMTPEVLDPAMAGLIDAARRCGCVARFTGAGGGGCVWALGTPEEVEQVRAAWRQAEGARLLDFRVDADGLLA